MPHVALGHMPAGYTYCIDRSLFGSQNHVMATENSFHFSLYLRLESLYLQLCIPGRSQNTEQFPFMNSRTKPSHD